ALGMSGSSDARVRLALARGGARALQDAALSLRRASGQLCRTRLGVLQAVLVAVAAEPHCDRAVSACAFRLCAVQGAGVALVALRSRFGAVRLDSKLLNTAFYGLYWKVIGWFMLLVAVTGVYFGLCGAVVAMLSGDQAAAPAAISRSIPLLVMIG